jgi:hypothetical protein
MLCLLSVSGTHLALIGLCFTGGRTRCRRPEDKSVRKVDHTTVAHHGQARRMTCRSQNLRPNWVSQEYDTNEHLNLFGDGRFFDKINRSESQGIDKVTDL